MQTEPLGARGALPIRTYRPEDFDALVALWREAGLVRPWNDPARDVARCVESSSCALFVAGAPGAGQDPAPLAGSVMAGFEGHRGWVYYLAVAEAHRGTGLGRALMRHAEAWIEGQGAPKVQLMIRADNAGARRFYERVGYTAEPRTVMSRWLEAPPATPAEPPADDARPAPRIAVHVTRLQMDSAPAAPPRQSPAKGLRVERAARPGLGFYRYLYREVGDPWLWWLRRVMPDEELRVILDHPSVSVNVLYAEGGPAGYVELDARRAGEVEIAYFGLVPRFIGRGYGPWLLDWAVRAAWATRPRCVWLHTCNLDHPGALGVYQRAGFEVTGTEDHVIEDPRAPGVMPLGMEFSTSRSRAGFRERSSSAAS